LEIRRWWRMGHAVLKALISERGDAFTEIDVDGTRAWVRAADLDAIAAIRPRKGAVHLVGGFDPLIVGAGLREQLLPQAHLKRVSRTAGWISPVVLRGGIAIGVWDRRRAGDRIDITVETFDRASPAERVAIAEAAEAIGVAQGLVTSVAFGRVFQEKGRKLVIDPEDA
jgi:hypothetical protein